MHICNEHKCLNKTVIDNNNNKKRYQMVYTHSKLSTPGHTSAACHVILWFDSFCPKWNCSNQLRRILKRLFEISSATCLDICVLSWIQCDRRLKTEIVQNKFRPSYDISFYNFIWQCKLGTSEDTQMSIKNGEVDESTARHLQYWLFLGEAIASGKCL